MRRYLRFFLAPVIVIACCAAVLSTYFEPIVGDLTRVGFFSERDFDGEKGFNGITKEPLTECGIASCTCLNRFSEGAR